MLILLSQGFIAAVHPREASDVALTVAYAYEKNIPCLARSGGHGCAKSLEAFQNGIVIDLRYMNGLLYRPETESLVCGGGVLTSQVAEYLYENRRELSELPDGIAAGSGKL